MTSGLEAGSLLTPSIRLVRPLGAGAMGSVWVADHLTLDTQVVVKFIGNDAATNPDLVARFTREAAAAAQVKSPHVVQMLDHGVTTNNVPYIVMELLEGEELAKYMSDRGVLPLEEVAIIVNQIAKALRRAHERRIVHRDIKPQNIFMCDVGNNEIFVKVLDFGIAKKLEGDITDSGTRTGAMIGTPYYMSPEQLVGAKDIDFRTDLWSLAVVAFQALTGRVPFHGENMASLVLAIHAGHIPVPSQVVPSIPPAVDAWFTRACTRDPAARFQSAQELSDAFQAAVYPGRQPSAPNVPAAAPPTIRQTTQPVSAVQIPYTQPQTYPRGMQSGTGPVAPLPAPGVRDSTSLQGFGATTGGSTSPGTAGLPKNNEKLVAMIASIVGVVVVCCGLVITYVYRGHGKTTTSAAGSASASTLGTVVTPPLPSGPASASDPPPPVDVPPVEPTPAAAADAGVIAVAAGTVPVQRAPQSGVVPLAVPGSSSPLPVPGSASPSSSGSAKPRPASSLPPKKNTDFDRQ